MKILVCVKQVPGSNNVEVDPVTGVLKRSGIPSKINPYDLYGIETALSLTERFGGSVESITMGPPQATYMLRECLAMGADEAVLVSGREFGGADTYATSECLAAAIRKIGVEKDDIVFCGRQAIDGDTAQVGPQIAEQLGIPQVSYADIAPFDGNRPALPPSVTEEVEIQLKYAGYLARQEKQVAEFKKEESRLLPEDIDYNAIAGLRLEARQKLTEIRPVSIGQAGRISGVSPADIAVLLIYMEQR